MKHGIISVFVFLAITVSPSIALAKGTPLFFQTGVELFEIEGAPDFGDGYSLGYACKRFAVFGADVWTWDCELMAVNMKEFAAGELDEEIKNEFSQKYSLGDRKRGPWNHYGVLAFGVLLVGGTLLKRKSS